MLEQVKYGNNIRNAESTIVNNIADILEIKWVMHALLPGIIMHDWLHMGFKLGMGYRSGTDGMIISIDVLCKK